MKKAFALFFLLQLVFAPVVCAKDIVETAAPATDEEVYAIFNSSETSQIQTKSGVLPVSNTINDPLAPRWEDYVPVKYQNPRADFAKGSSIAELSAGILLTQTIFGAPIGIPMISHSTTKLKNIGYTDKKTKFEAGLIEAQSIEDSKEREEYYVNLLKKCRFKESIYKRNMKKMAKAQSHS